MSAPPNRPLTLTVGCLVVFAMSIFGVTRVIGPVFESDSIPSFVYEVAILIGLGTVLAVLVYFHQAWARWGIILWFLFPLLGNFLVPDGVNYAVSWLFVVQVISVVLLYTPKSNAWLTGSKHAAH